MATAWRPNPCADRTPARGPWLRCFFNAVTYRRDKAVNLRFMVPARLTRLREASRCSSYLLFWLYDPSPLSSRSFVSIRRWRRVVYRVNPRPRRRAHFLRVIHLLQSLDTLLTGPNSAASGRESPLISSGGEIPRWSGAVHRLRYRPMIPTDGCVAAHNVCMRHSPWLQE